MEAMDQAHHTTGTGLYQEWGAVSHRKASGLKTKASGITTTMRGENEEDDGGTAHERCLRETPKGSTAVRSSDVICINLHRQENPTVDRCLQAWSGLLLSGLARRGSPGRRSRFDSLRLTMFADNVALLLQSPHSPPRSI
jgi:hypothetical protein